MKNELVIREDKGRVCLHLFCFGSDFGLRPVANVGELQRALDWCKEHEIPVKDLRKPALGPPLQPPNEHRTYIVRYRSGAHSEWLTYAQALTLSWKSPTPTRILRLDHVERVLP